MDIEILSPGAFASARVGLEPGESFVSEAGLMVRMAADIEVDVTTRTKGTGGALAGLKRMFGGDSFFLSTYEARQAGDVVLAPVLPGDVKVVEVDGASWICAGASYMGSGPEVELDTKFQGLKGLFSGESMFFMEVSGRGPLLVNAYGCIREIEVNGSYVVDTGHMVAYESTLNYSISKAGGSWIQSYLAGEGFVLNLEGHGKILIQSHNPSELGKAIGPKLPARKN